MSIGSRIRASREAKGLAQIDLVALARREGGTFTEGALMFWERDERVPRIEHIGPIARVLGMTLDELVYGNGTDVDGDEEGLKSEKSEKGMKGGEPAAQEAAGMPAVPVIP